jgi:hypothetical protein
MANIRQNAVLTGKLNDVHGFFRWPECEFSRGKARQDVSLRLKSSGSQNHTPRIASIRIKRWGISQVSCD